MRAKRRPLLTGILMSLGLVATAAYGDQIDQSLTLSNLSPTDGFASVSLDGYAPRIVAQTFTAGLTGQLSGVSVLISQPLNIVTPIADIKFTVFGTLDGAPSGSPLFATTVVPNPSGATVGGSVVMLGLSDIIPVANVSIIAGDTYAIGVQAVNIQPSDPGGELYQLGLYPSDNRDPYTGGTWLAQSGTGWSVMDQSPPEDAFFETYVNPATSSIPEPPTWSLLLAGLVSIIFLRFRPKCAL
jgi:hypothetical protein